jgi:hypothetical protein
MSTTITLLAPKKRGRKKRNIVGVNNVLKPRRNRYNEERKKQCLLILEKHGGNKMKACNEIKKVKGMEKVCPRVLERWRKNPGKTY